MSIPDCFEKITKILGKNVPRAMLRELSKELAEEQAHLLDPQAFQAKAEEVYIARLERDAAMRRQAKLMNLQAAQKAAAIVTQDIPKVDGAGKVLGYINGDLRRVGKAMNRSVQDARAALATGWLKDMRSALGSNLKVAESGVLSREITQEMDALYRGAGGHPVSGNQAAYEIARVYTGLQNNVFDVKKAYNPFMGRISDYFYRSSWDQARVSAMGKEAWVQWMGENFGDKTFPELRGDDRTERIGDVFDQIQAGTYEGMLSASDDPKDIMYRQARSRTLIPNDWEAFHNANEQFGRQNIHATFMRSIEQAAHDIAVMQKWGSSPPAALKAMLSQIEKTGSPEDIKSVKANEKAIRDAFEVTTKFSKAPATTMLARTVRGGLALTNLAKNNAWMLRALPDINNIALRMTDLTGQNYLESFMQAGGTYMRGFFGSTEAKRVAAENALLFQRSALSNMYQEYGGLNSTPTPQSAIEGLIAKGLQLQSHITLSERHVSTIEAGVASLYSQSLGKMTDYAHADLHPSTQGELGRYGIGAHEWEAIRKGTEDWSAHLGDGVGDVTKMVNVDSLRAIPDEAIQKLLVDTGTFKGEGEAPKAMVIRTRTELQAMVGSMINDAARAGHATLSQAQQVKLLGNHDPDSYAALARMAIMQFKGSTIKNIDTMARSFYSNPMKPQGDFTKVAAHMILASGLYMFGKAVKDTLSGKVPQVTPESALEALNESGAAGLAGQTIISSVFQGHGRAADVTEALLKTAGGPLITSAFTGIGLGAQGTYSLFDDKTKFPAGQLGGYLHQNIPYQNLFYTSFAFNYLYGQTVMEWMAPGYMGHQVRQQERRGQEYWLNPGE